jgi:glycosyltransferase involved in cell wall biosynthesis
MSFATKIVAVSETVKNYLIDWHKLDPGKVVTLYNGIDVDSFRDKGKQSHILNKFGLRTDFFTVGVVGRLVSVKGFDYFLDAAAIVLKTPKKVQFLIVGDGPLRGALEKRARDLGIHEDVVFTGFREEIPEILGVLDIFVTSSLSEGLPTAVLEAMCAGKPVVGTNVGAIPETVTNGDTGVIVPARDAESLANAILDLLDSPETRHKMGERGRQRVIDHFSIERMVENYERFYDSVSK